MTYKMLLLANIHVDQVRRQLEESMPNLFYGLRSGHFTTLSLLSLHDNISAAFDRGEYSPGVFVYVAKTFDIVNHDLLILKLDNMGIRGAALSRFRS